MSKSPPHPFSRKWHISSAGEVYGPFTGFELQEMVRQGRFSPEDFSYAEGGHEWTSAIEDPILQKMFAEPTKPADGSFYRPHVTRRWLLGVGAFILIVIICWIAWPYYSLHSLMTAAKEGDVLALENGVDWETLRQSVKADINALLARTPDKAAQGYDALFGKGLAMALAPAIINQAVDSLVTPNGIADRVKSVNKRADNKPGGRTVTEALLNLDWKQINYAFFTGGPLTFLVEVTPSKEVELEAPVTAIMKWSGTWRLSRIYFTPINREAEEKLENDKKTIELAKARPTLVTAELMYKGFKPSDFRKGEIQDAHSFVIEFANVSDRDIRAFDGTIVFSDLLDKEILTMTITIDEPIAAHKKNVWNGTLVHNEFKAGSTRLRSTEMANIKTHFKIRKVLYADGTSEEF